MPRRTRPTLSTRVASRRCLDGSLRSRLAALAFRRWRRSATVDGRRAALSIRPIVGGIVVGNPDGNYIAPGVEGGIVYGRVGGLIAPSRCLRASGLRGRPLTVVIHGGGYCWGTASRTSAKCSSCCRTHGLPWVSVEYRLGVDSRNTQRPPRTSQLRSRSFATSRAEARSASMRIACSLRRRHGRGDSLVAPAAPTAGGSGRSGLHRCTLEPPVSSRRVPGGSLLRARC